MLGVMQNLTSRLKIVVFANPAEFLQEMGQREFIGFMYPSLHEHSLIFARETRLQRHNQVPFHEYAHYLIRAAIPSALPRWYEEGLAQYFSTMEFEDDSSVIVGKMPRRQLLRAMQSTEVDWRTIVKENSRIDWNTHSLTKAYHIAWGLVHFIIYDPDVESVSIREQIERVTATSDEEDLFELLFRLSGVSEVEFERALIDHLKKRDGYQHKFTYSQPRLQLDGPRCLSSAEKHILLGTVIAKTNLERARKLLARALKQNVSDPSVLMALSSVNAEHTELALEYARRAYEIDSTLPDTNIILANALIKECKEAQPQTCQANLLAATTFYRAALELDPLRIDAVYGLGLVHLIRGQPGNALNYLKVVEKRAPWSPRVNFYLGEAYAMLGQNTNARIFLTKSARWEIDVDMQIRAEELLRQLRNEF